MEVIKQRRVIALHTVQAAELLALRLDNILNSIGELNLDQAQTTEALVAAADKAEKVVAEFVAATIEMTAAVAAASASTPAMDAAITRLNAALTAGDELNPDAPAPGTAIEVVAP